MRGIWRLVRTARYSRRPDPRVMTVLLFYRGGTGARLRRATRP